MKSIKLFTLTLALGGALFATSVASAHDGHKHETGATDGKGQLVPVSEKDAAWVAKAKAEYPTDTCIVSGDKLGADMGKPADFVYREEGKPDRLISFCCKDCVKDFRKDPAKYLKELDEAAPKKSDSAPAEHHQ